MDQVINLKDDNRNGLDFEYQLIKGDVDVAEVVIKEREELPIFLTIADEQILCICYLWGEDEIRQSTRLEMMQAMLEINIPMPLSSFAKIGDKYVDTRKYIANIEKAQNELGYKPSTDFDYGIRKTYEWLLEQRS